MSKGKVYHHEEIEEEEEEDIDLGFEEEEEPVIPYPYKQPQTEEQFEINRLTHEAFDLKQNNKQLKKELEWANKCSNDYSNQSEERWQEIQKLQSENTLLRQKQKKQIPEFIRLLFNTGKSEFTLEWLTKELLKKE